MGWFLILILGGPTILIVSYSLLYAALPQGANPSLILLPLILTALFVIAVAMVITAIVRGRRKRKASPTEYAQEETR
jgi:hypothetical protein